MNTMKRRYPILILAAAAIAAAWTPAVWASGPGEFKFDDRRFEVIEEAGMAVITVERSEGEDGAVTVDYMTAGGSAEADADYTPVAGTLTWADDDGSDRTFVVPILDDDDGEDEETIELILLNATGGASLDTGRSSALVVIRTSDGGSGSGDDGDDDDDDDGGDDGSGDDDDDDDDDDGSGDDDDDDDGNGNDGDDDDDDDDGSGDDDDDDDDDRAGTLKFDESSFEVLEDAGMAIVTVERSQGEDGEVTVDYFTRDGDAIDGDDYTGVTGTLSWFDGDGTDKTFAVPILDDTESEGVESFEVVLEDPTGGAAIDDLRATAAVRILANDGTGGGGDDGGGDDGGAGDGKPGVFKFDESSFEVLESAGLAVVTIERSKGEDGEASVSYATFDDTAVDGEDYTGVSGTLTWASGDGSNKTVMIPIADDDLEEGNESVLLSLFDPTGGAELDPLRDTSILTILDNDATGCGSGDDTLCLNGGRFEVAVSWTDFEGVAGSGKSMALSDQSGLFWFFDRNNVEMLIKVLDACRGFDSFWVFFAATTNVGFEVTVTDTQTGVSQTYRNEVGEVAAPVQDTTTFTTCN